MLRSRCASLAVEETRATISTAASREAFLEATKNKFSLLSVMHESSNYGIYEYSSSDDSKHLTYLSSIFARFSVQCWRRNSRNALKPKASNSVCDKTSPPIVSSLLSKINPKDAFRISYQSMNNNKRNRRKKRAAPKWTKAHWKGRWQNEN